MCPAGIILFIALYVPNIGTDQLPCFVHLRFIALLASGSADFQTAVRGAVIYQNDSQSFISTGKDTVKSRFQVQFCFIYRNDHTDSAHICPSPTLWFTLLLWKNKYSFSGRMPLMKCRMKSSTTKRYICQGNRNSRNPT